MREYAQFGMAVGALAGGDVTLLGLRRGLAGGGLGALDDIEFEAAARAADGDAIALPGGVGDEAVGQLGAAAVADGDAAGVLDGDRLAEDVAIALVAGLGLRVEVETGQRRVLIEKEGEGIVTGGGLAGVAGVTVAFPARGGVGRAVEFQVADGGDLLRPGVDPPVDEVEMVGGLVDEQAAGIVFFAMPATEIVSAMAGIQQPVQGYVQRTADGARGDEFAQA